MSQTLQTSAARLAIEERQFELTKFLIGDDPLGMVLRAHMHIEEELIKFIAARGQPEKDLPRGYARCADLAVELGLPQDFRKQLVVLGRLRNRFAHQPNTLIDLSDAEAFDAAHDPNDNVVDYAYSSTLSKLDDKDRKPSVKDLEPKQRVILHIITLWAGIAVTTAKITGAVAANDAREPHLEG
jgi:hypothetical protein